MSERTVNKPVSRSDFLKFCGIGAAAAGLTAVASQAGKIVRVVDGIGSIDATGGQMGGQGGQSAFIGESTPTHPPFPKQHPTSTPDIPPGAAMELWGLDKLIDENGCPVDLSPGIVVGSRTIQGKECGNP